MKDKKNRAPRPPRQEWKPNWLLLVLHRLWMVAFGAAKIALGAAATVVMIGLVCALVFVGTLGDYLQEDILPGAGMDLEKYSLEETSTIFYVDEEGKIQELQEIYATINRKWATLDEIPEDLVHAAIAIEDKRFYEHQGVDWITTLKACAKMFFGDSSAGGSTITQQLIKNLTQEDDITVQRKVQEIFRATEFEKRYDKDMVLTWYLNTIYMGRGCWGVKTAAAAYFGKELPMLTTAECASLISITNNPSLFDPYGEEFEYDGKLQTGMERNQGRQHLVLEQMLEQGWISRREYDTAMAQELVLKDGIDPEDRMAYCPNEFCGYRGITGSLETDGEDYFCPRCGTLVEVSKDASQEVYSWYTDTVLEDVAEAFARQDGVEWTDETRSGYIEMVQKGGYNIYSCLDMRAQNIIDSVYNDLDEIPDTYSSQQLQSAIVLIDNRTGDIVGMSGGVGEKTDFDAFNRATDATLQTGSSFKAVAVYAPAFESGLVSPATVLKDMPYTYEGGIYPLNDVRYYMYRHTVCQGFYDSVNAISVNTLDRIGVSYGFHFARDQFGIHSLLESYTVGDYTMSDMAIGPLALGAQTFGVTVREMASAFATFANHGTFRQGRTFTKVYDREGNLVLDNTQVTRDILGEKAINYTNYCLRRVVTDSTASALYYPFDNIGVKVYGKTGSSGDFKDRWFCGFTGHYTAAVWCGYDQPESISGGNHAVTLFGKVMVPLNEGKPNVELYDLSGMGFYNMCMDSGGFATDACSKDVRYVFDNHSRIEQAPAYPEDVSGSYCDKHVLVDYCMKGHGVATEYCKLFEKEGETEIRKLALSKFTQSELDEMKRAQQMRKDWFYRDDYIYLINPDGSPANFKGWNGNINKGINAPYLVCPVHTKEAWDKYQKDNAPTEPTDPELTVPGGPSEDGGDR